MIIKWSNIIYCSGLILVCFGHSKYIVKKSFATFSAFRIKKSAQLFFNSRKSAIFAPDFAFDFDRRERSLRGVIK